MGAFVDLFGLLMVGIVVRQILSGMPAAGGARVLHVLIGVVFLYGCIGFFGQAAAATGGLSFIPSSFEWPVLWPESTAGDASGNSILGLASSGRVQVYDSQGRFLRGWFVDASGGVFKLQVTSVGRTVSAAWPLWPLASPVVAWALFACGMAGFALSGWVKRRSRPTRS